MFNFEQYHIINNTTNEIVCSDWVKIPTARQIQTIMIEFGWKDIDDIEVIGKCMRFRVISNSKIYYNGKYFFGGIIEDRSYYVKFDNDDIENIRMIDY